MNKLIKKSPIKTAIASILLLFYAEDLAAQATQNEQLEAPDTKLNKNLNETASFFQNHGITFGASLTGDLFANVSGGVEQQAVFIDDIVLSLTLDLNRSLGLKNSSLYFSALQNNGASLSKYIGDAQVANNIEAVRTVRIFELWFEQLLLRKKLSVLAGVYDINTEFDYMQTGALFINSSHGIGAELGNSGRDSPSIFPATALAARIKAVPFRD
ncbi:MAG TPA: carbohydrate porin, partial [Balneolaceae bacterium]|nr:carbohydrate porin [Balneolaceae bacterium]